MTTISLLPDIQKFIMNFQKRAFSGNRRMYLILLMWLVVTGSWQSASAQVSPIYYDYPQNHLEWFTVESEHFFVHYQEGAERAAAVVSRIAEDVYGPITDLYDHRPDQKVSIILKDREDYSNGAAYFFDNKIDIWLPALNTPLRGTHDWLRNVITHEFTHIVQIQAMMTRKRTVPAMYFQWLAYEKVRRPDVLYGFPRGVVTVPFASVSVPAWFAEGTAQFQRFGLGYDGWDAHRDMILRTRILTGTELSFSEMGTFSSKSSLERETVYNQGFAFSLWLADQFGEQILADISKAASESKNGNLSRAIKQATGESGEVRFKQFVDATRQEYLRITERTSFDSTQTLSPKGYFNLYPVVSPKGSYLAWLSNGDREYSRTQLFLRELGKNSVEETTTDSGKTVVSQNSESIIEIQSHPWISPAEQHALKHGLLESPLIDYISGSFSFSGDERHIVFSKARKPNAQGELYLDLYQFDINTRQEKRITTNQRLSDPAWNPVFDQIATLRQDAGTQNLIIIDLDGSVVATLTEFEDGEALFTPRWSPDGSTLYFSMTGYPIQERSGHVGDDLTDQDSVLFTGKHGRSIWKVKPGTDHSGLELVLGGGGIDYRDPWVSADGQWLYFSANPEGWFALYRMHLSTQDTELVARVSGGAFMPAEAESALYFSEYQATGYKISSIAHTSDSSIPEAADGMSVRKRAPILSDSFTLVNKPSWGHPKPAATHQIESLANRTDNEVRPVSVEEGTATPYKETTTGISFFPLIRMDAYTQLNGTTASRLSAGDIPGVAENLWRDIKIGTYFASRDVREQVSLFGGIAISPGSQPASDIGSFLAPSRLLDLDRDLFLSLEYRGLPFIKKRWSPTVSVELINIKRNVADGLRIEEFPCTSCLPDTTSADIRYTVWEASVFLRSKLNRFTLVEAGLSYSPYRVNSDGFYSRELKQFIPESSSEYFKGTSFTTAAIMELIEPTRHYDIAPNGVKGILRYRYQPGRLLDRYEIEDGSLSAKYLTSKNHSLELKTIWGFHFPDSWPGSLSSMFTFRGFSYLNNPSESFYLDYIGGYLGMRSYPYFSLGGNRSAFVQAALLAPLKTGINKQIGPVTLDKVFLKLFYETGNAWGSGYGVGNKLKHGIGAEIRTAVNGFYLFPMKFFISGSYGLNDFTIRLPDTYITPGSSGTVSYGRTPLIYFGFTFDFDPL